MSWFDDIFKDVFGSMVKRLRLEWQKIANKLINEAEDKCVEEAISELNDVFPGLPADKVEAFIRKNYWKGMNYVKDKWDAEWIQDT